MTFHAPRPVVSGKPYVVRQVRGHAPGELADFAGQTSFVLDLDGEEYDVRGAGVEHEGLVRVFEKDDDGYGKDIRVWSVRHAAEGFTAEHAVS